MTTPDSAPFSLVTGATGFTGKALAFELRRRGYRVRALVRDAARAADLAAAGIELAVGNLTCADDVQLAARGCTHIHHIAALFRTAGHPDSYYHDVNVRGVEHVLAAAREQGVSRVVHCSTVGVHGHVREIPSHEESPYNPGDIYQETKLEGEKLAQAAMARGEPVCVVRPAGIYGPGDMRFLKLFRTIRSGIFRMFGRGEVTYHLTYIDDLVEGLILCGEHAAAVGQVFIISGDEYASLNHLVELIAEAVGTKAPRIHLPLTPLLLAAGLCETICVPLGIEPPLHRRRCEFFTNARAFTNAKAKRMLGYQPKVPLEEGIHRTAQWYREQGLLPR